MSTILFLANERGHNNLGWLDSYHTFSFGHYYSPERMSFGALRVVNDDTVQGGMGFGTHPHNDMEIISIPLEGSIAHKDSMGNVQTLSVNNVQIMSAGTGITHSEYNPSETELLRFFQIWIIPNTKGVEPRYDEIELGKPTKNTFSTIIGPQSQSTTYPLWMHQDAWLSLAHIDKGASATYTTKSANTGVFLMVIEGSADISSNTLNRRDAIGITETKDILVKATSDSYLLTIEVPMG
jgi:quercetin 2,3-dioxygenase